MTYNKARENNLLTNLGGVLLFICTISIVSLIVNFALSRNELEKKEITIKFDVANIKPDSLSTISRNNVEATLKLHNSIVSHVTSYQEAYNRFLERKEERENLIHYCLAFLSVIAGILSFFGFRTFQEIKSKAENIAHKIAEDTARNIASETASKIAKEMAQSIGTTVVNNRFKEINKTEIDVRVKEAVMTNTMNLLEQLDINNNTKLDELEKKLNMLNYLVMRQNSDHCDSSSDEVDSDSEHRDNNFDSEEMNFNDPYDED